MNATASQVNRWGLIIGISLVLLLAGAAGLVFFFVRMYQNDMSALEDFSSAYQTYDQAISGLKSAAMPVDGLPKARQALADLKTKATFRLSSLIKNEKQAMSTAQQIADLAEKELEALAASPTNAARSKELEELGRQRQAAYASFLALGQ